jgi:putative tricarboxylic transport membrane protein
MNKADIAGGVGVVAFGALLLEGAVKLPYTIEGVPGPGLLPLWLSLAAIATGLVLTVQAFSRSGTTPAEGATWPGSNGWRRIGIMLGALFVFTLLLEALGFLVMATLFVAAVIFGMGIRSWSVLASVPVLVAIILYGIFSVWLRVPLPKGILSFL